MSISPELRAFLQDWIEWVERGAPDGDPYWRHTGLCSALVAFNCIRSGKTKHISPEGDELDALFEADDLNPYYPFGEAEYDNCVALDTQHKDPNRLAWVRETLTENPAPDTEWGCEYCRNDGKLSNGRCPKCDAGYPDD